jgi:hypothetical protein
VCGRIGSTEVIDVEGTLFGVRTVARARQTKPDRTVRGKRVDPEEPKAWADVLCNHG